MNAERERLPKPGDEFAGYRIQRVLGRGGMGVVYLARHLMLDRPRALKLLPPEFAHDDHFRRRFIRESRAAAGIEHPNIIPIHEAAEVEGLLFLSMKFVEGSDLKQILEREGRLDPRNAMHLLGQVGDGLDAAHARNLVHRDIKPQNIFVASGAGADPSDHVYLLDFGLTKDLSAESQYTRTGTVMGTVHYMAPEQVTGDEVDHRTDVYSLGCVMFECLSGNIVYDKDTQWAVMNAHVNEPPPRLSEVRRDLPPAIDDVLFRALQKKQENRYDSAGELIDAARSAFALEVDPHAHTVVSPSSGDETEIPRTSQPTVASEVPDEIAAASTGGAGMRAAETQKPGEQDEPLGQMLRPEPPVSTDSPAVAPPPATKRRERLLLVGVAAVLAVGAGVVLLFLGGDGEETPDPPPASPPGEIAFDARTTSELPRQLGNFPEEVAGRTRINLIGSEGADTFAITYGDAGLGVEILETPAAAQEECSNAIRRLTNTGFEEEASESLEGPGGSEVGTATLLRNSEGEEAICWTNGRIRNLAEGGTGEALELMNAMPF